jgi:hypothetical protein
MVSTTIPNPFAKIQDSRIEKIFEREDDTPIPYSL